VSGGRTAVKDQSPAGAYFFFGVLALLSAAGDVRMLLPAGVSGRQRLVRHLWRICFGWFIATISFFLGQQQVFPAWFEGIKVSCGIGFSAIVIAEFLGYPSSLHKNVPKRTAGTWLGTIAVRPLRRSANGSLSLHLTNRCSSNRRGPLTLIAMGPPDPTIGLSTDGLSANRKLRR
jgi:hypothetical protein